MAATYEKSNRAKDIQERFDRWNQSADFYESIEQLSYEKLQKWRTVSKVVERKKISIVAGTLALQVVQDEAERKDILEALSLHMSRLENKQAIRLATIQGLDTTELTISKLYLMVREETLVKALREKKYSSKSTVPEVKAFFKIQEARQINLKRLVETSDKVRDAAHFGFKSLLLSHELNHILHFISTVTTALKITFTGLPIVTHVISGFDLLFKTIRTMTRGKNSKQKRIGAAILGVIVLGGIITAGVIAAAGVGVFVGLTVIDITHQITVLRKHQKKAAFYEKEIAKNHERVGELNDSNIDLTELTAAETHKLLAELQQYAATHPGENVDEVKSMILKGHIDQLAAHPVIKNILGMSSLKTYLASYATERDGYLKNRLKERREVITARKKELAVAMFGLVAIILLCIPTPMTMAVGAGLLLGTAVVGAAVKYKWIDKIASLFKGKKPAEPVHAVRSQEKDALHPHSSERDMFEHGLGGKKALEEAAHLRDKPPLVADAPKKTAAPIAPIVNRSANTTKNVAHGDDEGEGEGEKGPRGPGEH